MKKIACAVLLPAALLMMLLGSCLLFLRPAAAAETGTYTLSENVQNAEDVTGEFTFAILRAGICKISEKRK